MENVGYVLSFSKLDIDWLGSMKEKKELRMAHISALSKQVVFT